MSKIVKCEMATTWKRALNATRQTVGKKELDKEPSKRWWASVLLAEHSPIRLVEYDYGYIRLRIERNGNSQIYIDFADVMWVYNVVRVYD